MNDILIGMVLGLNVAMILGTIYIFFLRKRPMPIDTTRYDEINFKDAIGLVTSVCGMVVDKHMRLKYTFPNSVEELEALSLPAYSELRQPEINNLIDITLGTLSPKYLAFFKDNVIDLEFLIMHFVSEIYTEKMNELVERKLTILSEQMEANRGVNERIVPNTKGMEDMINKITSKLPHIEKFDGSKHRIVQKLKDIASRGGELIAN